MFAVFNFNQNLNAGRLSLLCIWMFQKAWNSAVYCCLTGVYIHICILTLKNTIRLQWKTYPCNSLNNAKTVENIKRPSLKLGLNRSSLTESTDFGLDHLTLVWITWLWPESLDFGLNHLTLVWINWLWSESLGFGLNHLTLVWITWHWSVSLGFGLDHLTLVWITWLWFVWLDRGLNHLTLVWITWIWSESPDRGLYHLTLVWITWLWPESHFCLNSLTLA